MCSVHNLVSNWLMRYWDRKRKHPSSMYIRLWTAYFLACYFGCSAFSGTVPSSLALTKPSLLIKSPFGSCLHTTGWNEVFSQLKIELKHSSFLVFFWPVKNHPTVARKLWISVPLRRLECIVNYLRPSSYYWAFHVLKGISDFRWQTNSWGFGSGSAMSPGPSIQ